MNKVLLQLLFVFTCATFLPISAQINGTIEARAAAFFPSSNHVRQIYGDVGGSYQLEGSMRINNCIDGWANFDWFSECGHSKGLRNPTRINVANFSFGVKFPYYISNCFSVYAGIGAAFADVWIKNKSNCGSSRSSKFAAGGVIKTGICYFVTCHIFLDLFVDYLYQPVHFHNQVDIGGFKTGLGLGYRF